jgi:hypothetical protein
VSTVPKNALSEYTPQEVDEIVALRCQELSALLGWPVAAPGARIVDEGALREARSEDVRACEARVRGGPRDEGLLSKVASFLSDLVSPSVMGYFGRTANVLFLNEAMIPAQAGYVLMHELTHAAQWQNHPGLFDAIDRWRVHAQDAADQHGSEAPEALAARDRYEPLVTFVEGHATLWGRRACEQRLLRDAKNVSPEEAHAFVEAMMGLDPSDETVARIYIRGERTLAGLAPEQVAALFGDPEQIVGLFAGRSG